MIVDNIINNEGFYRIGKVLTVTKGGESSPDLTGRAYKHKGIMLQIGSSTNNATVKITFENDVQVTIFLVSVATARPFFSSYILPCRVKQISTLATETADIQVVLLN